MSQTTVADCLEAERRLPFLFQSTPDDADPLEWAHMRRDWIEAAVQRHGALLFRGFRIASTGDFESFISAISRPLLSYENRSTPRSRVAGNIYTSTEFPANQSIPLHNELSYTNTWPLKIWFQCVQPSQWGGETPIADSRKVLLRIDPRIVTTFRRKRVLYVRNYFPGIDLSWQDVFQTTDRSAVEEFCRSNRIECEWIGRHGLRTKEVSQAVATHPKTGDEVWFNQAHLFHVSSLGTEVSTTLMSSFGEESLPRNAYYGDGSRIETGVLEEIRAAYEQEMVTFPWAVGDILMLDNMLAAHGRRPYRGARQIAVGMSEPVAAAGN